MDKHLTISDLQEEDYKYIVHKPDRDFNPERNYAVVAKVIDDTNKYFATLERIKNKDKENRIDILVSFASNVFSKGISKSLKQYLGREQYTKIIGEKILEKVRILDSIEKMNKARGNTKFSKFIQI